MIEKKIVKVETFEEIMTKLDHFSYDDETFVMPSPNVVYQTQFEILYLDKKMGRYDIDRLK